MIKIVKKISATIKDLFQFNIEWKFFKSPTAQEFKSYYPINYEYWDQLEVISIIGANLYSFGIDPYAIDLELKSYKHSLPKRTFPKGFAFRQQIIISAVQSGSIQLALNKNNKINADTLIKLKSFKDWIRTREFDRSEPTTEELLASLAKLSKEDTPRNREHNEQMDQVFLKLDELAEYHAKLELESQKETTPFKAVLPPLPLKGIAIMFSIVPNLDENLKIWKKHAKNAKRNNLASCRSKVVGGKAQSLFYPEKVAEWMIENGHMASTRVSRLLHSNLPNNLQYINDLHKDSL